MLAHFVRLYVGATFGPWSWASELAKQIVGMKDPVIWKFLRSDCPEFPSIPPDVLKVSHHEEKTK